MTSHHITYHIISHHMISHTITPHDITSHEIISHHRRYPEVLASIESLEAIFKEEVNSVDVEAAALYASQGPAAAVEFATQYTETSGNNLVKKWRKYFGQLFVKYRDGYVITESAEDTACGCSVGSGPYPQQWYNRIAAETGDHYLVLPDTLETSAAVLKEPRFKPTSKIDLLNRK
jgi:hypothetical protein